MPNYDYHCSNCSHRVEIFQKMTDPSLTVCPACQQSSFQRGPGGGVGLVFKGSGFYITDYDPARKTSESSSSCCPCGKGNACNR